MNEQTTIAFVDELQKIAAIRDLWTRFLDIFRSDDERLNNRVNYQFSPKAGKDRWEKLTHNVRDPKFVQRMSEHPDADPQLVQHIESMHALSKGQTVGKIQSARLPGKSYEVRKTSQGLACTCPDWRFKGSVNPGYECKHIEAYKAGRARAD